jgi:hypothetical protein
MVACSLLQISKSGAWCISIMAGARARNRARARNECKRLMVCIICVTEQQQSCLVYQSMECVRVTIMAWASARNGRD